MNNKKVIQLLLILLTAFTAVFKVVVIGAFDRMLSCIRKSKEGDDWDTNK